MTEAHQIRNQLADASERLSPVSESPRLDAELLMSQALDVPRSYLFAHPEDVLDDRSLDRFEDLLLQRLDGKPVAYLLGEKEFWSLSLMVSPATLIPRPDTEILVQHALQFITTGAEQDILDLGTGSGAIALAIARERPLTRIVATDRSEQALAVARQNATQLDIANVEFACGNWLDAVPGRMFSLIVSNPPYVAKNDPALDALAYEPASALVSGDDGLDDIRALATACGRALVNEGRLVLEHGATQQEAVTGILRAASWCDIQTVRDYAGLPRVTSAMWVDH